MNKFVYYATRVLLIIAFVLFIFFKEWASAFNTILIFLLILLPSALKKRYQFYLPFELDLAIGGFIFLTLFLGSLRNFYERFHWWDEILHFQSGVLLGIVGFVLVYILNSEKKKLINLTPLFLSIFSVTFSLAIGVVWEVYEYFVDILFGFNMQESGLPDTMGDLIVNGLGALFVATIAYLWMKKQYKIPFTPAELK